MEHEQPQNIDSTSVHELAKLVQDTEQKPQILDEKVTYVEKTERIQAWGQFIKSLGQFIKSVSPYLWAIVIVVVIIPLLGRAFIAHSSQQDIVTSDNSKSSLVAIDKKSDWSMVDQDIVTAIKNADTTAHKFASAKLDVWVDELKTRVNGSFLDQIQLQYGGKDAKTFLQALILLERW